MTLVKVAERYESDLLNVELEIYSDNAGEFWFHGATLCDIFELKNPTQSIQRHVDDDWRKQFPGDRGRESWFVTEPGLYQLLHASKHPAAKRFQRWVYGTVLPKLRSRGGLILDQSKYLATATAEEVESLKEQLATERQHRLQAETKYIALERGLEFTRQFIAHCLDADPDRANTGFCFVDEAFGVYKHYCKQNRKTPIKPHEFRRQLSQILGTGYDANDRNDRYPRLEHVSIKHQYKQIGYETTSEKWEQYCF